MAVLGCRPQAEKRYALLSEAAVEVRAMLGSTNDAELSQVVPAPVGLQTPKQPLPAKSATACD